MLSSCSTLSELQFNAVRETLMYVVHNGYCKVCRFGGWSSPRTSAFVFILTLPAMFAHHNHWY